jgi:formate dehydrogenase subunit gamma
MHRHFTTRPTSHFALALVITCFAAFAPPAVAQAPQEAPRMQEQGQAAAAERKLTQPLNNAPFWRDVRSGEVNPYQTTQVRGVETNVLIQTQGEIWRQVRTGPIVLYGGVGVLLAALLIGLFYGRRGPIRLQEPLTGRYVLRFTPWERAVHWLTAITFVLLAITGLITLFGRYVLIPVIGHAAFSWIAIVSKTLHNFVGPIFAIATILMIVTYARDNLPQRGDWQWMKRFGGLASGTHVPSWRFNAGEKIWFWVGVTLLGIVVSVTGFVLLFPNFEQGRFMMQLMNVIHATAAVIFIALSLGHIYLGTFGMEGSYRTMRYGVADETWAKEHHEYWYREAVSRRPEPAGGGSASAVPAAGMKDGWRL